MIISSWANKWILLWVSASCHYQRGILKVRVDYWRSLLSFLNLLPAYLANLSIPGLFSFIFCLFCILIVQLVDKILPMTGFEQRISGVGCDRSTNRATTSAHLAYLSKGLGNTIALVFIHWMRERLPWFLFIEWETGCVTSSNLLC